MKAAGILLLFFSAAPVHAEFLKPSYYVDQCAELAFEVAYEEQKFVSKEFSYQAPQLVDYTGTKAFIDVIVILREERKLLLDKDREFICGFSKDGLIVDYSNPFDGEDYEFDEPYVYNIVGDYVDIQSESCTLKSFSRDVAMKIAGGAAVGATLGITGGIIVIPVSGGLLVAAGSGGGAIIGGAVGGLVGTATTAYHCVAS